MGISTQSLVLKKDIIKYIPQRAPIIMVDELISIDELSSLSSFKIENNNIFCKDSIFDESGIIEHIAQSAALAIGYNFKKNNLNIPLGFIGSITKFQIHIKAKAGDIINTKITTIQKFMNITLIEANVYLEKKLLAQCQMKIALES